MNGPDPSRIKGAVPEPTGIVSVNSRGGVTNGITSKLGFALLLIALAIIGAVMAFNKYQSGKKADRSASQLAAAAENKPGESGKHRTFSTDPPPLPGAAAAKPSAANPVATVICPDNTTGQPLLGPDGTPMIAPTGQPIRFCPNGQVIVPAVQPLPGEPVPPVAAITNQVQPAGTPNAPAPARASRYEGEVILPASANSPPAPLLETSNPYIQAVLRASSAAAGSAFGSEPGASSAAGGKVPDPTPSPRGALGSALQGSEAAPVRAAMIGNRDMILPEGRSIDCNLSVRLINEVSGKATCVLSSNVYSDNGRVVLAERGSTAVGEYIAVNAQGQRRLFVLWTRLQTPKGVIINVNSPAADALGTSGLPGYVENRWSERIGAAVLLSLVQDAIGYATANATSGHGNGGAEGFAVFQSTTQAGRGLVERILESTINIKPTIYKNQGDRASIFVSRDLDFGSVYALRAQ